MDKESQYHFLHCIPKDDCRNTRISITFRKLRIRCDTQITENSDLPSTGDTVVDFLVNLDNDKEAPAPDSIEDEKEEMVANPKTKADHSNGLNQNTVHMRPKNVLYISSNMFRFFNTKRLSSTEQSAKVLFYPGANADKMYHRLIEDINFTEIDPEGVSKIYLMTGTNNVDPIYFGRDSLKDSMDSISKLLSYLQELFPKTTINVINILPRKTIRM